jgi:hypothetical protein
MTGNGKASYNNNFVVSDGVDGLGDVVSNLLWVFIGEEKGKDFGHSVSLAPAESCRVSEC